MPSPRDSLFSNVNQILSAFNRQISGNAAPSNKPFVVSDFKQIKDPWNEGKDAWLYTLELKKCDQLPLLYSLVQSLFSKYLCDENGQTRDTTGKITFGVSQIPENIRFNVLVEDVAEENARLQAALGFIDGSVEQLKRIGRIAKMIAMYREGPQPKRLDVGHSIIRCDVRTDFKYSYQLQLTTNIPQLQALCQTCPDIDITPIDAANLKGSKDPWCEKDLNLYPAARESTYGVTITTQNERGLKALEHLIGEFCHHRSELTMRG